MLNKKIISIAVLGVLFSVSSTFAITKPAPNSDLDSLSYVFFLYYENGQIFADRDYNVKYDIIEEAFTPPIITTPRPYKVEIVNFKFEVVGTFDFDPQNGDSNFNFGKIQVRAPYIADGMRANFYDNQGSQLVNIFISTVALCDNNNLCNSAAGENETTCPSDCKIQRTPVPVVTDIPVDNGGFLGGFDLNLILIYAVGGIGIAVGAWLFMKWRKKKKAENFQMPPPSNSPPPAPNSNSVGEQTGEQLSDEGQQTSSFPSGPQKPFPG